MTMIMALMMTMTTMRPMVMRITILGEEEEEEEKEEEEDKEEEEEEEEEEEGKMIVRQ